MCTTSFGIHRCGSKPLFSDFLVNTRTHFYDDMDSVVDYLKSIKEEQERLRKEEEMKRKHEREEQDTK